MKSYSQILTEGVYDQGIFKAFFMAGGPGSGKSFVTNSVTSGLGMKLVNSDVHFERMLKQVNLSLSMPDSEQYFRDMIRGRAKSLTNRQIDSYVEGRLGMVVDATGRDYKIIHYQVSLLKQLGYDCYMIFVNTSLDVAKERNKTRSRQVPEFYLVKSWETVQSNMGKFQRLFGMSNFIIVDNNKSESELVTLTMSKASKIVRQKMKAPIQSHIAKRWIANELASRKR